MNRSCDNCTKSLVCAARWELDNHILLTFGFLDRLRKSPEFWQMIASKCSQYTSSLDEKS